MNAPTTIQQYIDQFSGTTKDRLQLVYVTIQTAAPQADESISYGLPTFKVGGKPLIYFGGFTKHIGLYATPDGHAQFEAELAKYKRGKGSVQFPHDQPLPVELIRQIVEYRKQQITE